MAANSAVRDRTHTARCAFEKEPRQQDPSRRTSDPEGRRVGAYFLSVVASVEVVVSGSSSALASAKPFLNSFCAEPRFRASFGI